MRPRAAQFLVVTAAALGVVGAVGAASAVGAADVTTVGAPNSQMVSGGGLTLSPASTWAGVSLTSVPGWNFTVPRKGIVRQVDAVVGIASGGGALAITPVTANLPSGAVNATITGVGTAGTVVPSGVRSVSAALPVVAGDVVGIAWTGVLIELANDGSSSTVDLWANNAAPVVGGLLAKRTNQGGALKVQATIALAPASSVAPTTGATGAPIEGEPLTATTGTWDSSPTAYRYEWQRCDTTGGACTAITGAASATYTPTAADAGSTLRVLVVASNVEGGASDPVASAVTAVVQAAPAYSGSTTADSGSTLPASTFFAPVETGRPKVTLCHATASASNPYVVITVAPESVITQGHDQHQDGRDIIPPFDYVKAGTTLRYPGLNWNAQGQAILAAGCQTPKAPAAQSVLEPPVKTKVTLCHATGSASNPYVVITVAPQAIFNAGHDQHQGREDIIPPFTWSGGTYLGLNWGPDGRSIYDDGCKVPQPDPTPIASTGHKVDICHRVGGPHYVQQNVAVQAALNGHAKNHPDDIIPPFQYSRGNKTYTFAGQNWDAVGKATWLAGCVAPPAPQPVRPVVNCIDPQADGTYVAYFGYASDDMRARSIAVGADNLVSPDSLAGPVVVTGQPTLFAPGMVDVAVAVSGVRQAGSVSWTITSAGVTTTVTASAASPRCARPANPENVGVYAACVTPGSGGTYSVTFGYQNDDVVPVEVAVGAANRVVVSGAAPGAQDRGQPASLAPGLHSDAFTVSGIPRTQGVTWTVVVGGVQRIASASSASPLCGDAPEEFHRVGPAVACVKANGDGTYDATFGYANPNGVGVHIPAGPGNSMSVSPSGPGPEMRGQPVEFEVGTVASAFTVRGIPVGQALTWTVAWNGTSTATAGARFPTRCAGDTPDPPEVPVTPASQRVGVFVSCVIAGKGTYTARFGYTNPGLLPVSVAVGAGNRVTGGATADRGQPTLFTPGTVDSAFEITGIPMATRPTWRVVAPDGQVAEATADPAGPSCVVVPPTENPIPEVIVDPPGGPGPTPDPPKIIIHNPDPPDLIDPEIVIPDPPGIDIPKVVPETPGTKCVRQSGDIRCTVMPDEILPGRKVVIDLPGATTSTPDVQLGAVATVTGPTGARPQVASSSGRIRVRRAPAVTG